MSDNQNDDPNNLENLGETQVQRVSEASGRSGTREQKPFRLSDLSTPTKAFVALCLGLSIGGIYFTSSLRSKAIAAKSNSYELDPSQVEKRKILPDYTFIDANSHTHKLSEYHGNVVILSFWASWCSPCLIELPTFSQMQKKLKNGVLKVLAVNVEDGDEGKKFAEDFWKRNKFDFLSFFDTSKQLAQSFEVELLPSNFVIDKSGRLAFSGFGSTDWSSAQIVELIDGLIQEAAVEVAVRPPAPTPGTIDQKSQNHSDDASAEEDVD
jgi:thiol-disulfide isomerase/thioredoxin